MKVLDVDLFQDGLQRNIAMLERLRSETEVILRSVEGLVQMDEMLKGEGGNAIRTFYGECHLPFLQFFQLFSMQFKHVLHQIEAALFSLEPDTAGYILEQFLEGELEQGLTFIGQFTASLTDQTNSVMDEVSDIIGLPHLDDSGVQEGVIHSKRKRDDTITRLYEFDANQTTALNPIEMDIHAMDKWLSDIEGLFIGGLTDINFHKNDWVALTSQSRLKVELEARQSSLKKLSHVLSWEKLQSIYQTLLDYAKPIRFGFGGTISKENPFVGTDMIALSCPVPEADDDQQEDVNPFMKSMNSFSEMGKDFWNGLQTRADKSLDSPYDFVNYITLGATDGIWSGAKERADKMFESKTDFANYATFGFSGMVKEAVFPEDSFSKEHWQNSFGLATSIFGAGKLMTSPTKPGLGIPKETEIGVSNRNVGKISDLNELMDFDEAKRYAQFHDKVAVGMDREARFAASRMDTNSFMNSILPIKLKEHNLSYNQFRDLRLKPYYKLNDSERMIIQDFRDSVPRPDNKTTLIKNIHANDIQKYLDGEYITVKGFVAKAEDSSHIHDYSHVRESMRLDYSYYDEYKEKVVKPYPEDGNSYGYIEFKVKNPELLSPENLEIPYGHNMKKPYSGWESNEWPWTGNGFTASRNGDVIPEWTSKKFIELEVGAKLHRVVDGKDEVIGIFNGKEFILED